MVLLFYYPAMEGLARSIADCRGDIRLGQVQWNHFPDGFPNTFVHAVADIRGQVVVYVASMQTPATLFEELGVIWLLARYLPRALTVVLPFYPTGASDTEEEDGRVATASSLARLFSTVPALTSCMEIVLFDVHEIQESFYFADHIRPRLETAAHVLVGAIGALDVAVVFPDDGAHKRFRRFFNGWHVVLCSTRAAGANKKETIVREGGVEGRVCVILDDLIRTGREGGGVEFTRPGRTIRACAKALAQLRPLKIFAVATHGLFGGGMMWILSNYSLAVFPTEAAGDVVGDDIEKIFVSDSCPATTNRLKGLAKFEVVSLAHKIATDAIGGLE